MVQSSNHTRQSVCHDTAQAWRLAVVSEWSLTHHPQPARWDAVSAVSVVLPPLPLSCPIPLGVPPSCSSSTRLSQKCPSGTAVRRTGSHTEDKIAIPYHCLFLDWTPTESTGPPGARGLEKSTLPERGTPPTIPAAPNCQLSVFRCAPRPLACRSCWQLAGESGQGRFAFGSPGGRTSQGAKLASLVALMLRALGDRPAGTPKPTLFPTPDDLDRIPPSHIFLHSPPTRSDLGCLHAPFATTALCSIAARLRR